jgi:O-succinylbenzoic acid--CoA ligase
VLSDTPLQLRAGDVVACSLAPHQAWVGLLREAWDAHAAVLPLDSRLPIDEMRRVLQRARPTVLVSADGWQRLDGVPADEEVGAVVATSGSTGMPRLVELARDAVAAAVTSSARVLGATPDDAWLCCIPVAHIGGLLVLLRHVILGAPVVVNPFSVDTVVQTTEARFASVVPTQLRRLLADGRDLGHLRALLVGGTALPGDLRGSAVRRGVMVVATYGLTESCGGVVYDGRPLPGTDVRIAGGGEVQLHGPTLMRGYRFDSAATSRAFTADGWLRTRDAGAIDAAGSLVVHGRVDDAIVSGGEKIWPQEVEAALETHPDIAEVAVRGEPDPEWGERVVAYVVPRDPASPPALGSLRAHAGARLARFKAPRELVLVDHLERTALGKMRRVRGDR